MKRIQIWILIAFIFSAVIFPGCQKEIPQASNEDQPSDEQVAFSKNINIFSPCRLLSWNGLDDGYARTLHYNNKGLMDSWDESAPLYDSHQYFTIEYDHNNHVSKIKYYDADVFLYTIIPVYKWGRITEELWYDGDTQTLVDDVINTYNFIGRIVKRESINGEYYSTFKYDLIGNNTLEVTKDTYTGALYDSLILGFKKPVIEPMNAAPGMPYPIPFINYVIDKLKYSSFDDYYEDGDGNIVEVYKQDDSKSVLKANRNHYASFYDTYDIISGLENRQVWHYENCGPGNNNDESTNMIPVPGFSKPTTLLKQKLMLFATVPQMTQRIIELRKQKIVK